MKYSVQVEIRVFANVITQAESLEEALSLVRDNGLAADYVRLCKPKRDELIDSEIVSVDGVFTVG